MTARQRIDEIHRELVDQMCERDDMDHILIRMMGTTRADLAEGRLKDPKVRIEAIIEYLNEVAENVTKENS